MGGWQKWEGGGGPREKQEVLRQDCRRASYPSSSYYMRGVAKARMLVQAVMLRPCSDVVMK